MTYIVEWIHLGAVNSLRLKVSEAQLDGFLQTLRFNGITSFSVKLDS